MNNANRRGFLKIAGVGAAAAGAASLAPSGVSIAGAPVAHAAASPDHKLRSAATGSMTAYVHEVSTGEIVVMIEGGEVVVTDHDLVARLANAVHAAAAASV